MPAPSCMRKKEKKKAPLGISFADGSCECSPGEEPCGLGYSREAWGS